jgi:hypothetical protein
MNSSLNTGEQSSLRLILSRPLGIYFYRQCRTCIWRMANLVSYWDCRTTELQLIIFDDNYKILLTNKRHMCLITNMCEHACPAGFLFPNERKSRDAVINTLRASVFYPHSNARAWMSAIYAPWQSARRCRAGCKWYFCFTVDFLIK